MKKYNKIERFGKKDGYQALKNGTYVVVSEKLDGSNASFRLENGEIECFSRNQELSENNTLRGFYNWVQENIDINKLTEGMIYYGEWLVKHAINYDEDNYNQFYLFDIYIEDNCTIYDKTDCYADSSLVEYYANKLNVKLAPIFYKGKFISIEHIQSFVGKSELGEVGEGVVAKAYDYRDRFGRQKFFKFVSDEFAEKAKAKKHKIKNGGELDEFVNTFLTKARVEKILYKLVDEGVIEEDFGLEDMGTILKNSSKTIADDILEEEIDSLLKIVKKKISKAYPHVVKEIILDDGN